MKDRERLLREILALFDTKYAVLGSTCNIFRWWEMK